MTVSHLPAPSSLLFFLSSSHYFFSPSTPNLCLAHSTDMVSQKTAHQLFLSKWRTSSLGTHTLQLTTSTKEKNSLGFQCCTSQALLLLCPGLRSLYFPTHQNSIMMLKISYDVIAANIQGVLTMCLDYLNLQPLFYGEVL